MKNNEFIFTWKIVNFSSCTQIIGGELKSPVFKTECFEDTKWFLSLYPRGSQKNEEEEFISCYLVRCKDKVGSKKIELELRVEVIASSGFPVENKILKGEFWKTSQNRLGWDRYMNRSWLFKHKTSYLPDDQLTIVCRMVSCSPAKVPPIRGKNICTEINVDKYSFKWDVKYPLCHETRKISFSGSTQVKLAIEASSNDNFHINIRKIDSKNQFSSGDTCYYMKCKVSLLDAEEREHFVKNGEHLFDPTVGSRNVWDFTTSIKKIYLKSKENTFLSNDSFTLLCDLSLSNGSVSLKTEEFKFIPPVQVDSKTDTFGALQNDLICSYNRGIHTDIELRLHGNTIGAHKYILAIRSSKFNEILKSNHSQYIDIQDMDADTLDLLLKFIYTGSVPQLGFESAMKLIVAAHEYQVPSLKEECSIFLKRFLTVDTVCEVVLVAYLVEDEELKGSAIAYLKKNLESFLVSDEGELFLQNNPKLAVEIFGKVFEEFRNFSNECGGSLMKSVASLNEQLKTPVTRESSASVQGEDTIGSNSEVQDSAVKAFSTNFKFEPCTFSMPHISFLNKRATRRSFVNRKQQLKSLLKLRSSMPSLPTVITDSMLGFSTSLTTVATVGATPSITFPTTIFSSTFGLKTTSEVTRPASSVSGFPISFPPTMASVTTLTLGAQITNLPISSAVSTPASVFGSNAVFSFKGNEMFEQVPDRSELSPLSVVSPSFTFHSGASSTTNPLLSTTSLSLTTSNSSSLLTVSSTSLNSNCLMPESDSNCDNDDCALLDEFIMSLLQHDVDTTLSTTPAPTNH